MSQNISFVSESVIEEQRKQRQSEWEKTRKEDDPLGLFDDFLFDLISNCFNYLENISEAPEIPYDPRTLYERLQEQKMKKQEAYDESHKLKNLIKGLDNDEIEFLNIIDSNKAILENQKYQEELLALEEYKRGVVHLNTEEQDKKLLEFKRELFQQHKNKIESQKETKKSQANLLMGAIKRKGKDESPNKRMKNDSIDQSGVSNNSPLETKVTQKILPAIKCIGILPGIGCYDDNSDSDDSDRESDEDDCMPFRIHTVKKVTNKKDK